MDCKVQLFRDHILLCDDLSAQVLAKKETEQHQQEQETAPYSKSTTSATSVGLGDGDASDDGSAEAMKEIEEGNEEVKEGQEKMDEEKERGIEEGKEQESDGEKRVEEGEEEVKEGEKKAQEAAERGDKKFRREIKVCDGMGCKMVHVAAPQAPEPKSTTEYAKEPFNNDGSLWSLVFPWEHSLDAEVHLNDKGEIRADHDDPNGKLMPHNRFQNARYPDGEHGRNEDEKRPGITNSVASHLFSDNIVTAAPGFNAGLGRHVRAQQYADWHRNWESVRTHNKKGQEINLG